MQSTVNPRGSALVCRVLIVLIVYWLMKFVVIVYPHNH